MSSSYKSRDSNLDPLVPTPLGGVNLVPMIEVEEVEHDTEGRVPYNLSHIVDEEGEESEKEEEVKVISPGRVVHSMADTFVVENIENASSVAKPEMAETVQIEDIFNGTMRHTKKPGDNKMKSDV